MIFRPSFALLAAAAIAAGALSQSPATDPAPATDPSQAAEETAAEREAVAQPPEIVWAEVPQLLRMHVVMLGPKAGIVCESLAPGSEAESIGLRAGDILLENGGRRVKNVDHLAQIQLRPPLVVLRQGQIRVLPPTFAALPGVQPNSAIAGPRASVSASAASSAQAGRSAGRAVSISQAGDQISLEMSLPRWVDRPIRFQGTRAQIQRELALSDLPAGAKREVRAVLSGR